MESASRARVLVVANRTAAAERLLTEFGAGLGRDRVSSLC
jgi:hypothetical protein